MKDYTLSVYGVHTTLSEVDALRLLDNERIKWEQGCIPGFYKSEDGILILSKNIKVKNPLDDVEINYV